MEKLDQNEVSASRWEKETIPFMQIAVFVMCGGGFLGRFAAAQPENFYIDSRVGRLPYRRKEIYQAVETLKTIAKVHGFNTRAMPIIPNFHNMGIF